MPDETTAKAAVDAASTRAVMSKSRRMGRSRDSPRFIAEERLG